MAFFSTAPSNRLAKVVINEYSKLPAMECSGGSISMHSEIYSNYSEKARQMVHLPIFPEKTGHITLRNNS